MMDEEIPTGMPIVKDTVDAGTFDEDDIPFLEPDSHLSGSGFNPQPESPALVANGSPPKPPGMFYPSPSTTPKSASLKPSAGAALFAGPSPKRATTSSGRPAGNVLKEGLRKSGDFEVQADDVFKDLDTQEIILKPEGATDSVKHFMGHIVTTPIADVPDAGGESDPDWEDNSKFPQQRLMTQRQQSGAVPTEPSLVASATEEEFKYKMNNKERGCFIIFNQKKFLINNLEERHGTEKDAANLQNTAKMLGFEYVRVIDDCTKEDMMAWIETVANADHTDYDCFVCCVLTHGGKDDVLYAKDGSFMLKELTTPFRPDKCPSLAGKPKLFFVQACRGFKLMEGAKAPTVQSDSLDGLKNLAFDQVDGAGDMVEVKTIPVEADFLIGQSTVPEFYSWRNASNGSIFIQNLCAGFHKWGHTMELMQIMTRVNRMTAYDFQSSAQDPKMSKKKQIPSITTRLTAELYFTSKTRQEPMETGTDHASVEVADPAARGTETYHIVNVPRIKSASDAPPSYSATTSEGTWCPPSQSFYPPPLPPKKHKLSATPNFSRNIPNTSQTPPIPIIALRKTSLPVNQYSRSADSRGIHKNETTPNVTLRKPRSRSQDRRSVPGDVTRVVVTDQRLKIGFNMINKSYEETDI
uniref:Uncharacterized protein LOC100178691 n=1 Tax=Phallusia mammillata TaxID=59560 RepID=A0A6F9DHL7_9ASCI|nr:uncharacterized protein LOC100178691 [Phallusia mammillata]